MPCQRESQPVVFEATHAEVREVDGFLLIEFHHEAMRMVWKMPALAGVQLSHDMQKVGYAWLSRGGLREAPKV